jgi:dipeptidyl aminopeptidase/acylaminoacyl peptidase
MKSFLILVFTLPAMLAVAQSKRQLDHPDFAIWKRIENTRISNNGAWVAYDIVPGEGDPTLVLYDVATSTERRFPRGGRNQFTDNSQYAVFTIVPPEDTLKALRRRKVDKEKLPPDTLVILNLETQVVQKIPDLQKVSVPDRWSGFLVYQVKPVLVTPKDTVKEKESKASKEDKNGKKTKTSSKQNGYPCIIRNLVSQAEDTLSFTTDYALSKYGDVVAAYSSGTDSTLKAGVYIYNCGNPGWQPVKLQKGTYKHLAWSDSGDQLAFVADMDTTKVQIRPYAVYRWVPEMDSAELFVENHAPFMSEDWHVSENYSLKFSADGTKLHFGIAPEPLLEDTTLLDEEKVSVEVWNYRDARMYTQQNVLAKSEKERTYHCIADIPSEVFRQVANAHLPESRMDRDGNSPYAVLYDESPYLRESSWKGQTRRDVWIYDIQSGQHKPMAEAVEGVPQLSPGFSFVYWYHAPDSAWFVSAVNGTPLNVSEHIPVSISDELNDVPAPPDAYGVVGWVSGDSALLVYDRFDIWSVDPTNKKQPVNLTNGRSGKMRYRYVRLDRDERSIDPTKPLFLRTFNEGTKASGYSELDLSTGQLHDLISGDMDYDNTPLKARDAEVIVYTEESFEQFPNLRLTSDRFATSKQISDANPQQKDYQWGTAELFSWTAYDGQALQGLLIKPDGFDPSKKYPLIVNFYERSTDGLHQHRAPFPHRSTINYHFYASRGYVIFNPDVPYQKGYPGESAYNSVVSGTEALVREGFIDPQRMALQGHSWGGYQVAYLLTRTGIYACAEAGAVVIDMVSAYGGIRWETGLSRMFQYEHYQSRIGGSLWEKPELYIENSPLFALDKVSTPVLILQNDSDGHVPWYQGIEFFAAMRRLNKPAWLLNYNGEPHWPVKLQNRKDFNIRMQQFFDHYLMKAPEPKWMRDGVPATEKGILQGLELIEKK